MQKKLSVIWHDAVGGLPSDFWILWSGILVNRIGAMAFPFLSFFLASKGFSENVAALVLLSAVAMLAMPWGNSVFLIDLCAFLAGFAFDFQRPAVLATVADLVPVSDRVRAFGLNYWAVNIGASLAPLIGGVLAAISFLFLFTFDAVSSLCYFLLIFFRLREPAQHLSTSRRSSPFAGFSDPRMLLLFVLSSFLTAQFFQAYSTLPLVMRLHGLNVGDYSRAIIANGLTVVIFSIPLSRILQRWSAARALALAAACVGIGFFLTQFAHTQRGVYQGTYSMSWSLGILVGPALGGWVLQTVGGHVLWSGCGIVGCLVAIAFWLFFDRIPPGETGNMATVSSCPNDHEVSR